MYRYLAPETMGIVKDHSRRFKSEMKKLWTTKAAYMYDKALPHVKGEFNIPILRVGPDGEMLLPSSKSPKIPTRGLKRGPKGKPYLEKRKRARQLHAARIAKGQDEHALMHAASSKIGKFNKDVAYVTRKIMDKPQQASKFRHIMKKKNRGTLNE